MRQNNTAAKKASLPYLMQLLARHWLAMVLATAVILLTCILITDFFTKPIADDFARLTQVRDMGILRYWHFHLTHADGRYSNALFLGIVISLFGSLAVQATLIITLLCIGATLWVLLKLILPSLSAAAMLCITGVFSAASMLAAPSLFDSAYWMNAETIYTISVASIIATLSLGIWIAKGARPKPIIFTGLLMVIFALSGFNEIAPTISLLGLVVAFLAFRPKKREHIIPWAAIVGTQFIALLVMWAAPGANTRKTLLAGYNKLSLFATLKTSTHHFFTFFTSLGRAEILFIVAAGIVLGFCAFVGTGRYRLIKLTHVAWSAVCTVYCIFVPIFIVTYAGSARFDGLPPYRAQIFSTTALIIFVATVAWYAASRLSIAHQPTIALASLLALLVMVTAGFWLAFATLTAVTERYIAYDQRDTLVRAQAALGQEPVHASQVPLYTAKTEATDLPASNSSSETSFWVIEWFSKYYGLGQVLVDDSNNLGACPAQHIDWYINGAYCKQVFTRNTVNVNR